MHHRFAVSLSVILFGFVCLTNASAQAPPPPGGGSTGGGYGPGGGGSSGGGSTGNGNANNVVGGSALRDNATGGSGGECCFTKDNAASSKLESGGLNILALEECLMVKCLPVDSESDCRGCCDSGNSTNGPVAMSQSGCGSCGGGGPVSGNVASGTSPYTTHKATRNWAPWNRPTQSSFGPGVFSNYDSKIYFYPDAVAGVTASVFDAEKGRTFNFVDGLDGDTADGVFHDLRNRAYKSLTMKDASGNVVTSLSQADHAELLYWGGLQEQYDVFDLSADPMSQEFAARLESATDTNGNTISIAYRDALAAGSGGFTAQELTDSPDRQWQIHQITDRRGDVFTYSYQSTQESGRWVVEKIDFPNSIDVDYSYADGHLSTVDHPNGDVSSYTYGQDSVAQTATVVLQTAGAGPARTIHLTNDYMTLDASGQAQVINQPQGILRMSVSSAGETLSMIVPDSNQAGVYDLYHGTGSASNVVVGVSHQYYADGWTPVLVEDPANMSITPDGTPEDEYAAVAPSTTIEDFYQGTIPGETDDTGRDFTYDYDTDGFLTKKTFVADSTYEEYAHNSFKQLTRLRDRQGNVTAYEYDANGNMTKQKTGLKEVGGQDVAQPEYAELQWAYYPTGHANAGQLKTAFDAEWDGSSADTHRTDYEYNARGLMTKKLESASITGGDRPETNWTYDANDRVATTTDPGGHQSDDTYNDRGQLIEKEYDDTSTEQTLYGALGTPEEGLVVKTKDRRNVVTSYTYDSAGRTTQVTVGTAWDADILDGNADDTPITDRNEQSITTYVYLDGTELPIEVVRDGSKTEFVYDYRQRVIETKVYPYAGKIMSSKVVYVDNKKFSDEDYYGRKKFYGYRASDGQLIRYVTGAYPSFSLADQTAVFNLVRDTNLNPAYTVKDAITDENGRPETFIDERGVQTFTEYNSASQVIRVTKALGTPVQTISEMDYDEDGNVIEIRSPRYFDSTDTNGYQKCKTVMTYDGQGRVLTRTHAPGAPEAATESYAYNSEGRQVTRTDARGKIWTTNYASCCGHSVSSKNPLGHGSISNKDNGGLVTHTAGIGDVDNHTTLLDPINAKTLRETTTRYDALGQSIATCTWLVPQGVIDPENPPLAGFDGISGQDGLTAQTLYDADLTDGIGLDSTAGVTVTNPLGGTFTVSLSAALTKMAEPMAQGGANTSFNADATGSAVVNLNAENEVGFAISDSEGRTIISGIQHPHDPLSGNTHGDLLTWNCQIHDTTGQLANGETVVASINVDAHGHTTRDHSNGLGHTLETIDQLGFASTVKYDATGNAIETRDPNQTGYDMVYDDLNRNTSRTDMVGSQTQTAYDKAGQQIQAIDAQGKAATFAFDARNNRITEIDRLGHATNWAYDAADNLLSLIDAENQTTRYTYDDAGNKITEQYPDHVAGAQIGSPDYGIITFIHNELGRRIAKEDQQGDTTTYNFDLSGRMLSRVYVGHPTSSLAGQTDSDTFTYDRRGQLLSGHKGRYNNDVIFSYDDRGERMEETLTTHGETYVVGCQKNALGQTTQLQYPDGSLVDRTYTERGQLLAVKYTNSSGVQSNLADLVYDDGGREVIRNLGNGLTTARSYFADNQIHTIDTPTVETLTYTYDPNKNPTSETRSGAMSPHSWSTGSSGFDDEDRLTALTRTNGSSQTWNLTPVQDWSSSTINGVNQTRSHGSTHEILTMSGAQVSQSPAVLSHDPKGNMTTDDHGATMTWDFDNSLQDFDANNALGLLNATYEYDAIGRRVAKSVSESGGGIATTLFLHAEQQVVCEYTPGNAVSGSDRKYVHCRYVDEVMNIVDSSGVSETRYWLHQNRQYSTYSTTQDAAAVLEFYSYTGYGHHRHSSNGALLNAAPLDTISCFLTGRDFDSESSLLYFRTRYFSPSLDRFISRDSLGMIDGANLYANYFGLKNVDPSGATTQAQQRLVKGPRVWVPGSLDKRCVAECVLSDIFLDPSIGSTCIPLLEICAQTRIPHVCAAAAACASAYYAACVHSCTKYHCLERQCSVKTKSLSLPFLRNDGTRHKGIGNLQDCCLYGGPNYPHTGRWNCQGFPGGTLRRCFTVYPFGVYGGRRVYNIKTKSACPSHVSVRCSLWDCKWKRIR